MNYSLNKYDDEGKDFIRYVGKVISIENHRGSSVSSTTTNTISSGKILNIQSRGFKYTTVKVILPTGRHKEFDSQGIEMQEGDEVEFVITDLGREIYANNISTGIEEVAQPVYHRPGLVNGIAVALVACVGYGLFKIFGAGAVLIGLVWVAISATTLLLSALAWQKRIDVLKLNFQEKLLLTGVKVKNFKPVQVSI